MAVHAYNTSCLGGGGRRIINSRQLRQSNRTLFLKLNTNKRPRNMSEVVKNLCVMHKTLGSIAITAKIKKGIFKAYKKVNLKTSIIKHTKKMLNLPNDQ
jgi:hypothetical protein